MSHTEKFIILALLGLCLVVEFFMLWVLVREQSWWKRR